MNETLNNEVDSKTMDMFDKKLTEADEAIKNGAKFYTRDEVNKILDVILKSQ